MRYLDLVFNNYITWMKVFHTEYSDYKIVQSLNSPFPDI